MRSLTATFLFVIFSISSFTTLSAQTDPAGEKSVSKPGLSIVGKNKAQKAKDFCFKLGEILQVQVTGKLVEKVETEWGETESIALYFDGERIAELSSPPLQVVPVTDSTFSSQQTDSVKELLLNFTLVRDAEDDAKRKAWDRLFMKNDHYQMEIQPSLAIGNGLPLVVQSDKPLKFSVASTLSIWLIFFIGLAILLVSYRYLVTKTRMLCDAETNYYSLGKSQMAFWGLLVVLSFTGIWILTGTMERIPSQALILLGISGATGLSSVMIGKSKRAEILAKITEEEAELSKLELEEKKLQEQQIKHPAAFSQASQDRLMAIKPEIDSKSKKISKLSKQADAGKSKGFWRDICNDGNGASFHRLQVVIWTLVLGAVFVQNVLHMVSMPEFPDTLLTLLGISNATYVGFKIPEKS